MTSKASRPGDGYCSRILMTRTGCDLRKRFTGQHQGWTEGKERGEILGQVFAVVATGTDGSVGKRLTF